MTHTCSHFCDRPECVKAQRDWMRDIHRCYEELRAVIDGGSESMTHDDAVASVKHWIEENRRLREAARMALGALEWHIDHGTYGADIEGVRAVLRDALGEADA